MTFDVAARLADARPAVGNTETYVSAARAVGYQQPDLTAHGAQVTEWFAADDGLDLNALDADCADLQRAVVAIGEAVRLEHDALGALATAWEGASGSAAVDFIERHCHTGKAALALFHSAAEVGAILRDNLWRGVDAKVDAAIAIDERRAGERSAWLAASHTAVAGGPERAAAVELIEKAIVPYVDSDIRTEWVEAMRSAAVSAATAYSDAINQISPTTTMDFEVPTQLIPAAWGRQSLPEPASLQEFRPESLPAAAALAPQVAPEVAPSLPIPHPPTVHSAASPTDAPTLADPLVSTPPPAMGAPPSTATSPTGFPGALPGAPDLGGGLPGLFDGDAAAPNGLDYADRGPELDDTSDEADEDSDDDSADDAVDDSTDDGVDDGTDEPEYKAEESASEGNSADPALEPVSPPAAPIPATPPSPSPPPPPPPPPPPVPEALGNSDESTPCEIAADELPQVGQ